MQLAEKFDFNPQARFFNKSFPHAPLPQFKSFKRTFFTTLKESNATQNIYFSNYIEWQGAMREQWFFECIDKQMLTQYGVFVTKTVHQSYMKEGFPFQNIECILNSFEINKCSFKLLFRFYIDDELISSGYQKIAFTNHKKKVARLPDWALEKIREYEISKHELENSNC